MPKPRTNSLPLIEIARAHFQRGHQMKTLLEERLLELRNEIAEIESMLAMFENKDQPRLLTPVPDPPKQKEVTGSLPTNDPVEGRTSVVAELMNLLPFWHHLAPRPREIVELRVSGMKPSAIAEKLNIKPGAVSTSIFLSKNTLNRARERSSKPTKPQKHPDSSDEPAQAAPRPRTEDKNEDEGKDDRSILGVYMKELRRHPVMSREEEHDVAVRYATTGAKDLEAKLVTSNLRLVVMIANQHRKINHNLTDLVQEGNLGLLHGLRKYDPNRGIKLASYASWWIKAYILKFILANWRLVKLGTTQSQRKLFFNLRKEKAKLEKQGIIPNSKILANALDVKEDEVEEMEQRLATSDTSLDAPVRHTDEGGAPISIGETMISPPSEQPDLVTENSQAGSILKNKIRRFESTLQDRDLKIFRERLIADEPATLIELAATFGVTRERVRQLETKLKKKLHEYLSDELGDVRSCLMN